MESPETRLRSFITRHTGDNLRRRSLHSDLDTITLALALKLCELGEMPDPRLDVTHHDIRRFVSANPTAVHFESRARPLTTDEASAIVSAYFNRVAR